MKSKIILALMLSFIMSSMINAQRHSDPPKKVSSCIIKGSFLDSIAKESEPYATIKITKKEFPEKIIKMAVTDKNGNFQINTTSLIGTYIIHISSVGKETIHREFTIKKEDYLIDLGKIYTKDNMNKLNGVEVVAQKPLVKMDVDKIQYDIESDPDSKTNTVIEMLRKVPLVTVDGDDNIKVNGSSNFKIYVNGKPNTMMSNNPKDVLKSMPANLIKRIEVITSPGAKYDAEGTTGILNIVTIGKSIEGYTATFRANIGNRGEGTGAYVTVKSGKLTLSANINISHFSQPNTYINNYRENYNSDEQKYLESNSTSKYHGNFQYSTLEGSYEIDSLRLLSTAFTVYGNNYHNATDGLTNMWNVNRDALAYGYTSLNKGTNSWQYIQGNIDYQRTSKKNKDRMFTLSYKISNQPQKNNSDIEYTDIKDNLDLDIVKTLLLNDIHSNAKTSTAEHTFQGDYTTPLGKYHTIETGLKYILRKNSSNNMTYVADKSTGDYIYNNDRSSHYKHLNNIVAAYLSYTFHYKNYSLKPGIRYEYTYQKVRYLSGAISSDANFSMHYSDIVPSITTGFKIGNTQNIRAEYNMRIMRPGIWNLNPYFDNTNPMSISQGNSNLRSEKSHNINLSYSIFSTTFNLNLEIHHSFNNNGIEGISRLIDNGGEWFDNNTHYAPAGAIYTTYENIGKSRKTGLSLYANWNPSSKIRLYINGDGGYSHLKSSAQDLKNSGWNASLYGGIQYTFPSRFRISMNSGGGTPEYTLQGKSNGYYFYSLNLNRSFLKDRFTVSAYISNFIQKYHTYNNSTNGLNFYSEEKMRVPNRSFGISLSYRLGNLRASVKKVSHSITNDDIKSEGSNKGSGQTSTK